MTPMQERLEFMAGKLGKWAYFSAFTIFIIQSLFFIIKILVVEELELLSISSLVRFLDFFSTAVAIIVVSIPEGLPLAVSLSIAFSLDSMKSDNILVKNNEAFEKMGMVDQICTGKTSTLTNGKMDVQCYITCGKFIDKLAID